MTGQGTETGRNALAGLPAVQSRRLHRNRLYRRGERTFSSLGRRTSATLQDDTAWHYTYNQRSEITSAIRKNASNVTQNNMRYVFDNIGNRTSSYEDATSKTYDANCLNQYTEIDVTGGSSVCPLYDDDGNMTQFDSSTYTYDAENRLVGAQNGTTRLEFIYDALGRRVARKLYLNNTLSKHHRYVYDGMKLLATYNAKSSFAKINSFLWQPFGLDVPLIMTYNSTVYGYLVDANKNVLGLFNPSKTRVATYLYGPFGQKLSESGTIAANNPIQFSSEQFDADLDLVYYNYRYYSPAIGKWLTKDPIGEMGGWNLYAFCRNDTVNTWNENGNISWIVFGVVAITGSALLLAGAAFIAHYFYDKLSKTNCTGPVYAAGSIIQNKYASSTITYINDEMLDKEKQIIINCAIKFSNKPHVYNQYNECGDSSTDLIQEIRTECNPRYWNMFQMQVQLCASPIQRGWRKITQGLTQHNFVIIVSKTPYSHKYKDKYIPETIVLDYYYARREENIDAKNPFINGELSLIKHLKNIDAYKIDHIYTEDSYDYNDVGIIYGLDALPLQ